MTSILESEYNLPLRPYSDKELQQKRINLFRMARVGEIIAFHPRCNHTYFVRSKGRKEQKILETHDSGVGNCSICWKLSKTPNNLYDKAIRVVESYTSIFFTQRKQLKDITYSDLDILTVFYKWLYLEH